ncbi:MAG: B12-binding domain-containing radical SAM protein [Myxococcales bacterium]|nr:B12-binding domain-containing radical SAM protein [Myxococcales bacterium]
MPPCKIVFAYGREEKPVLFTFVPLASMRLAALCDRHGMSGLILDAKRHPDDWEATLQKELSDAFALVIMGKIGRQLEDLITATQIAKRLHPEMPVIFAGWQAAMAAEANLGEPTLDYCTVGTAETTLPELLTTLAAGGDAANVPGIAYKRDGEIKRTAPREFDRNLDEFAAGWDKVDLNWYIERDGGRCQQMIAGIDRAINYTSSRGCHGKCRFCHITAMFERGWFGYSAERVLEDLTYLKERYGVAGVDFHDSNFFTNKVRARRIVEGMIERRLNIAWKCSVRVDQLLTYEDDLMAMIRDSGCRELAIGGESGSQRIMDLIEKEIGPEAVRACSERVIKYGMNPVYSFMVGFPDEKNWVDTKMTLRYMAELKELAPDADSSYFYYTPFPDTPLYDWAHKFGLPYAKKLSDFLIYSPYDPNMPWVDARLSELLKMATRFYFKFAIPDATMRERLRTHKLRLPLRLLSKISHWRVHRLRYEFPIEYRLARFMKDTVIGKWGWFKKLREVL